MSNHAVKMVKGIGLRMIRENPEEARKLAGTFIPWYLHNRIRSFVLPWEQQVWGKTDGHSQNPRFITINVMSSN